MKTTRGNIKKLGFSFYCMFGKLFLTVSYIRNGEHTKVTFSNIKKMKQDEKSVRKFLNK